MPDRISPAVSPASERGRVVEWDIVHEPLAGTLPPGGEVSIASLSAWVHWVRRSIGDPTVVDEELGVALCEVADIRDGCGDPRSVGLPSGLGGCCMASIQDDAADANADTGRGIADFARTT